MSLRFCGGGVIQSTADAKAVRGIILCAYHKHKFPRGAPQICGREAAQLSVPVLSPPVDILTVMLPGWWFSVKPQRCSATKNEIQNSITKYFSPTKGSLVSFSYIKVLKQCDGYFRDGPRNFALRSDDEADT
ncbi:hypothetical protein AVEN_188211-1 [Araneus ventricosus]|uniref:Uncharacterized protein n=1 Tax=Araneus ventricosus TaxID=182803 RepID=A0A4Y2HYR0_ARAVE|nr:hypothetical protein AVEN_188211-1 [Araneus ventricosus]